MHNGNESQIQGLDDPVNVLKGVGIQFSIVVVRDNRQGRGVLWGSGFREGRLMIHVIVLRISWTRALDCGLNVVT